ncbi:MAG: GNAT family N-acetyltransferase [Bauldia sp.]|nr:GNAT family N-acetyltransferase [Bauldia sp.]
MRDGGEEERGYLIATLRLVMRAPQAADAVAIGALAANPAIAPNLCATIPADTGQTMVIVERRTDRLIGAASHGATGLGSGMEVSLWIGEPYWGRGYATEAAQALIDAAFDDAGLDVLWCANRVTNARARRVIEKCGFQFRGAGMIRVPGRGAFPIERFALDRGTWTSLKAWGGSRAAGRTGDAPRETAV